MNTTNLAIAKNYYHHMLNKDFVSMAACLHPDIHFLSPFTEIVGKEKVAEAAKSFGKILSNMEIRAEFSSENQTMLVYDFMLFEAQTKLRAAAFMEFNDHHISKIELFFDSKLFEK